MAGGPGKQYQNLSNGKVRSYEQLVANGLTGKQIEDMLSHDIIREVKKKEASPDSSGSLPPSGSSTTPPVAGQESAGTSTDSTATVPPATAPTQAQQTVDLGGNTLENRTALPEGAPATDQPDQTTLPDRIPTSELNEGNPSETTVPSSSATRVGQSIMDASLQQFQAQVKQDAVDRPRLDALEKKVRQTIYAPDNQPQYLDVKKPKLNDAGVPDSRYTFLKPQALDELLSTIDQVDGMAVSDRDRQIMRNRISAQVENARSAYDIMEAAKRHYSTSGKEDKTKDDPVLFKLRSDLNSAALSKDEGVVNEITQQIKERETALSQEQTTTDPISLLQQNQRNAAQDPEAIKKGQERDAALSSKINELDQQVKAGQKTASQASDELRDYHSSLQQPLDEYIQQKALRLTMATLPNVVQEHIDALKKKVEANKGKDAITDPLNYEINQLQEKLDKGETYDIQADPRWTEALAKGYKDYIITNNEKLKTALDNTSFNKSLPTRTAFRDQATLVSKLLQGLMSGVGNAENTIGGVLNMYGQYTIGNNLTDNGKRFAAENGIPVPMDKDGNAVVYDGEPGNWIAQNVMAQIPNMAALMAVSEATGGAADVGLARMGLSGITKAVTKGAIGGMVASVPESVSEAGDGYNQYIAQGMTPYEAQQKASQVFRDNIFILGLSDPIEFGLMKLPTKGLLPKLAKNVGESQLNGLQEIAQGWAQDRQSNPAVSMVNYAGTTDGISAYLSGAAVGIIQNAIVGQIDHWSTQRATARAFDFASQFKNSGNQGLPGNHVIAKTVFNAFAMKDTPKRKEELERVVDRHHEAGSYTDEDADRVKGIIDHVYQVKNNVPDYATPEQQTAILNELLQAHTRNQYKQRSGSKAISDLFDQQNAEGEKRIQRIMSGEEPMYFVGGFETNKDQLLENLQNEEFAKHAGHTIQVFNDPETQQAVDDIVKPGKKQQAAQAVKPQVVVPASENVDQENAVVKFAAEDETLKGKRSVMTRTILDALANPATREDAIHSLREQVSNPDEFDKTFSPELRGLVEKLGPVSVGRTAAEMTADLNSQVAEKANKTAPDANDASKLEAQRAAELEKLLPERGDVSENAYANFFASGGLYGFYNQMFDALKSGTNKVGGIEDKYVAGLRPAFDEGKIKSAEDVWRALNKKKETDEINARYDEQIKNLSPNKKGGTDAVQEQISAKNDVRDQSESGTQVPVGNTEGKEATGEGQAQKEKVTRFGLPAENMDRKVSSLYNDYQDQVEKKGADEDFSTYDEQMLSAIDSAAREKGKKLKPADLEAIHTNVMSNIYEEAGFLKNEEQTLRQVVDAAIDNYSPRKSKKDETTEEGRRVRLRKEVTATDQAETSKEKPAEKGSQQASSAQKLIGQNTSGDNIYEDGNGVRSIVDNGIRRTEPVSITPTKSGVAFGVENRRDEYKTRQESRDEARKTEQAAKPPTAEIATENTSQNIAPDAKEAEIRKRLEEKKAKFRKNFTNLNSGINPQIIIDGVDMLTTYAELGMHKFGEMVRDLIETFGKDFFTKDNTDTIKGVYAYYRSNAEDNISDLMDGDKEVKEFIRTELPSLLVNENDNGSAADQPATDTTPAPDTIRPDKTGVDGRIPAGNTSADVSQQDTSPAPGTESGVGNGDLQQGDGAGKKRGRGTRDSERNNPGTGAAGQRGSTTETTGTRKGAIADQGIPENSRVTNPADRNHHIEDNDVIVPDGKVAKAVANMDAILLVQQLENQNRNATPEEKKVLAKFVGWGGLSDYLKQDDRSATVVRAIINGGDVAGYGGDVIQRFDPIDRTGKSFDAVVREVQDRYNKATRENNSFYRYVPYEYRSNLPLDDARALVIQATLSPREFDSAVQSTANAHYTERNVISGMWDLVKHLGFKGGSVLESSAGVGHFLGLMPTDIADKSRLTAVEKDTLSGRILSKLYPQANVIVKGFEDARIPNNSIDLSVGNVPFAAEGHVSDSRNKDIEKFNLHNYFIGRTLKLLKPGGIAVLLTSKSTMDNATSARARTWFSSAEGGNSDFVGAVRLPNNMFAANAGTEVTTDMMIFQKRKGTAALNHEAFQLTEPVKSVMEDDHLHEIDVNEYYMRHPENMLGEMAFAKDVGKGGLYSKFDATLHAPKGMNVLEEFKKRLTTFPADLFNAERAAMDAALRDADLNTTEKEGRMYLKDGKPFFAVGELGLPVPFVKKTQEPIAAEYIPLRDHISNIIALEQNAESTDEQIDAARVQLNKLYDDFVKKNKTIHHNSFLYDFDIDYSLASSVENVNESTVLVNNKNKKVVTVTKSDIFSKRVNFPRVEPSTAENLADAIRISTSYRNQIDEEYVGKMLGVSAEQARADMLDNELVFESPEHGRLMIPDEYLSGNVREKLENAKLAAEEEPKFLRNVSALEGVMPEDQPASVIRFKMGVSWLPSNVYQDFIKEKLGVEVVPQFLPGSGKWAIGDARGTQDSRNTSSYAVADKTGLDIIKDLMNNSTTLVYVPTTTPDGKPARRQDEALTAAAQDMQDRIVNEFSAFVKSNDQHRTVLENNYNKLFNNYVERKHSLPEYNRFPGASEHVNLREHQKRAVLRILNDNTLLAHSVGTGKTYIMISAAMEMRRLGLAKKPMIVVQNSTLKGFAQSFQKAYPGSKILIPGDNDMSAERRRRFFARIATGDWDAVIMPQSQVDRIPDDPVRVQAFLEEKINEIKEALDNLSDDTPFYIRQQMEKEMEAFQNSMTAIYDQLTAEEEFDEEGNPIEKEIKDTPASEEGGSKKKKDKKVKDIARMMAKLNARVKRQAERKTDNVLYFDQLNVDALMVDEAHAYKRLGLSTGMHKVRGIDTAASKRALSILLKIRSVKDRTGGKNVVMATGTPITNTLAEAWTMMRYMRPEMLQEMGIQYFDQFVSTFAQVEPSLEMNAGGRMEIVNRLFKFFNQPELVRAFRSFADVVTTKDIPEFVANPDNAPPKLKDGKPTAIVLQPSQPLKGMMRRTLTEYDKWKALTGKEKKAQRAVPLLLTMIAKNAAIDTRLIDPHADDDPSSKVNRAVGEVLRIYKESTANLGTQMIFLDNFNGTRSEKVLALAGVDSGSPINLYRDIKNKLIEGGIPASQIAIINETKYNKPDPKKALFDSMNEGAVRVVMGSTEKMGIGVNAQERMIALHHIDAPPRPDQFEQRNGRILRQGNMFAKLGIPVQVLTYGVEGARDSKAFDTLQRKQAMIDQVMKGEIKDREIEDPTSADDVNADDFFAEMGANLSGSKYATYLVFAKRDLKNEQYRQQTFAQRQIDNSNKLRNKERGLQEIRNDIFISDAALKVKNSSFDDNKIHSVEIDGVEHTEKLGDAIDAKITQIKNALLKNASKTYDDFVIKVNGVDTRFTVLRNTIDSFVVSYSTPALGIANKGVDSGSGNGFLATLRKQLEAVDHNPVRWRTAEKNTVRDIETLRKELNEEYDSSPLTELKNKVKLLEAAVMQENEKQVSDELKDAAAEGDENSDVVSLDGDALEAEIEKAKKELRDATGGQLSSGIPLNALPQLARVAILYVKKGLRSAAQFAREIGARLDKTIVAAWNEAKQRFKRYVAQSQQMGVISPSMRKFMNAGASSGGGGNANTGASAQTNPAPPGGSTKQNSLQRLAQLRQQAMDNYETLRKKFETEAFGDITTTDQDFKIKPTIGGRLVNIPNVVQDVTFGKATKAVSAELKRWAEKALQSKNAVARRTAKTLGTIFANIGKTAEDVTSSEKFKGESRVRAVADAVHVSRNMREIVDNDAAALDRVNRVLDPEFYKNLSFDEFGEAVKADMDDQEDFDKIPESALRTRYAEYQAKYGFDDPNYKAPTVDDLGPQERRLHDLIRLTYDMIHELSFSIGKITPETYEANQGKYAARLYDYFEIPKEAKDAMRNNKTFKVDESLYKQRGDISEWKLLNRLSDPVYAVTKRLHQSMANKAVIDYANYVAKTKKDAISKDEQPGYRRLGYGYGALSGRFVRDDIAEDFIGHFYADKILQDAYDFLKRYDRIGIRQFQKKLFTVYNPGVHLGNITGNLIFGSMVGVAPTRLVGNVGWAVKQAGEYSADYRYLLSSGLLQSSIAGGEFANALREVEKGIDPKQGNFFKMIPEKMKQFYGATDDIMKMAAFKSLLEMGYKPSEAVEKVKEGFQNYNRIGSSYDFFSKVPLVGAPFGKFAGDLSRIIINGITTRPLTTYGMLAGLKLMSLLFSYMAGETDEQRKLRESRRGFPHIPLPGILHMGDIPLAFKMGDNEANLARLLSPLYLYSSGDDDDAFEFFQKLSPQPIEIPGFTQNPAGWGSVFMAKNANDPTLGPLTQLIFDSDFRGAPILDPTQKRFESSTLTPRERAMNALRFLGRGYVPYGAVADDIAASATGHKDYYQRQRPVWQVMLNIIGPKITKFPDTRYGQIMEQKLNGYGFQYEALDRTLKLITRKRAKNEITQDQFERRAASVTERMAELKSRAEQDISEIKGKIGSVDLKHYPAKEHKAEAARQKTAAKRASENPFDAAAPPAPDVPSGPDIPHVTP